MNATPLGLWATARIFSFSLVVGACEKVADFGNQILPVMMLSHKEEFGGFHVG